MTFAGWAAEPQRGDICSAAFHPCAGYLRGPRLLRVGMNALALPPSWAPRSHGGRGADTHVQGMRRMHACIANKHSYFNSQATFTHSSQQQHLQVWGPSPPPPAPPPLLFHDWGPAVRLHYHSQQPCCNHHRWRWRSRAVWSDMETQSGAENNGAQKKKLIESKKRMK